MTASLIWRCRSRVPPLWRIQTRRVDIGRIPNPNWSRKLELRSVYPEPKDVFKAQITSSKQTVYLALFGNLAITASKAAVCIFTGSSAMLSEAIHSLVDSGNQALLLIGLNEAESAADARHQYGYGKSVYFWSLVSALGTFWCGAGISMWNSVQSLLVPSIELHSVGMETWGVLGVALLIDGTVLYKTLEKVYKNKPAHMPLLKYIRNIRDPTMQAVLMEDAAACVGVGLAVLGIGAAQYTGVAVFDAVAGMGVSCLLGGMGLYLARLNQKYLMGQSVEKDITDGIKKLLLARQSVDEVHSVQSQWVGPYSFSYKAEIDFDGTYIAAKLMKRYKEEFMTPDLGENEIKLLLAWYSEDVIREVEMEIRKLERRIRYRYPEALYIELEPDGGKNKDYEYTRYVVDDARGDETKLASEIASINNYEASFDQAKDDKEKLKSELEYFRSEDSKKEGEKRN